jgi:hypothetical protein
MSADFRSGTLGDTLTFSLWVNVPQNFALARVEDRIVQLLEEVHHREEVRQPAGCVREPVDRGVEAAPSVGLPRRGCPPLAPIGDQFRGPGLELERTARPLPVLVHPVVNLVELLVRADDPVDLHRLPRIRLDPHLHLIPDVARHRHDRLDVRRVEVAEAELPVCLPDEPHRDLLADDAEL